MTEPDDEGRSTRFSVVTGSGEARDVYVNPWGAEVLGAIDPRLVFWVAAGLFFGSVTVSRRFARDALGPEPGQPRTSARDVLTHIAASLARKG